jgi:hypothetical protein
MKAVLIATDYLKDIDNSFKTIETNTGLHMVVKNISNYINIVEFDEFLSNNNIDTIEMISPKHRFDNIYDLDAEREYFEFGIDSIEGFFHSHYSGSSITFNWNQTKYGSVTIPTIEDTPNKLILRISFDTTALIDDTYAKDNWEYLKLIHDSEPSLIPATYVNDSELGFDSIGTTVRDNGGFPNYIIKERFPTVNYMNYPKILKLDDSTQLTNIKNSLLSGEYLQEYIYNPNDIIEGKLKTYRTITMVYGGNLDTFNFMSPYEHTNPTAPSLTVDYDNNGHIQIWERPSFLQKLGTSYEDNRALNKTYHFDSTSKILMNDGSIKNIDNLIIGDTLKTLDITGLPSDNENVFAWTEEYGVVTGSTTEIPTYVQDVNSTNTLVWLINLTLEDGIKFSDVQDSNVLSQDIKDPNKVRFINFSNIEIDSIFIIYDLITQSYLKKRVISIEYTYEDLNIYTLNVESQDSFLTTEEGVDFPRYVMMQHNAAPSNCTAWCCSSSAYGFYQCINSGGEGYCNYSGYYEYCSTSSPNYNCNQCAPECASCGSVNK